MFRFLLFVSFLVSTLTQAELRPLMIGQKIPAISLPTVDADRLALREEAKKNPLVLIFYRGGWCPYCNEHLGHLQEMEGDLKKMGYRILAVSPDRPEKLAESLKAGKLSYTLLSDSDMKAATAFGLAFEVGAPMLEKLASYHIDLEEASGQKHHQLPVPAVFLVGTDGVIDFVYANPDYTTRLAPEILLAAAKAACGIKGDR